MEILVFAFVGWLIGKAYRDAQDRQEELHRSYLHEHGASGWHEHEHHGNHIHPEGMDGPFHYVPEREKQTRAPRRPSDDLYLPPRFREEH